MLSGHCRHRRNAAAAILRRHFHLGARRNDTATAPWPRAELAAQPGYLGVESAREQLGITVLLGKPRGHRQLETECRTPVGAEAAMKSGMPPACASAKSSGIIARSAEDPEVSGFRFKAENKNPWVLAATLQGRQMGFGFSPAGSPPYAPASGACRPGRPPIVLPPRVRPRRGHCP